MIRSTKSGMVETVEAMSASSLYAGTTTATLFPSYIAPTLAFASVRTHVVQGEAAVLVDDGEAVEERLRMTPLIVHEHPVCAPTLEDRLALRGGDARVPEEAP